MDIGAEKPGLIHVRELTADRVEHANEVVKEGAELEAKVIGVDRRRRRLDLSVRALEAEMIQAVATDELPAVTANHFYLQLSAFLHHFIRMFHPVGG